MSIKDLPIDRGSRILTDPNNPYFFLSVPNHPQVDRNTLRAEIRKWAQARNLRNGDDEFRAAYERLYGKGKKSVEVRELEVCSMCREIINPEDETITHQASGLKVHKSCHDANVGPAPVANTTS